jgi:hypothetical protein
MRRRFRYAHLPRFFIHATLMAAPALALLDQRKPLG